MQKTTVQSQQESKKKQERDLCCFENHATKKKNMRTFNVTRPRPRKLVLKNPLGRINKNIVLYCNIYQITSPTTCNFPETSKRTSFEELFHVDYFTRLSHGILSYFRVAH